MATGTLVSSLEPAADPAVRIMDYEYAQRRRTFVAIALTLVLGPAAFLLTRGDDEPDAAGPPITVVGTAAPVVGPPATAPSATDVMGTSPVEAVSAEDPNSVNDPATIAIPRPPKGVTGQATFSRRIAAVSQCLVSEIGVPFNSRVTVTNLNNSHKLDCINNVGGPRPEEAVVLHADAFLRIADLTDAPVPVRITW